MQWCETMIGALDIKISTCIDENFHYFCVTVFYRLVHWGLASSMHTINV